MFRFRTEVEMFDEVFTLGYPRIPFTAADVVGHRAEVNVAARLFVGSSDVLLTSKLVSPGSSGGPVLDSDGFCVRMSTKCLEAGWNGEKARLSAAIPATLLAIM